MGSGMIALAGVKISVLGLRSSPLPLDSLAFRYLDACSLELRRDIS